MPNPIRVTPSSIIPSSSRGSLLDGAYTAGVAYASPLRRGQLSPRFVLFLAVFSTIVLFVSNLSPQSPESSLDNPWDTQENRSEVPIPGGVEDASSPWLAPQASGDLAPAIPRLRKDMCSLRSRLTQDETCGLEDALANLTASLRQFAPQPMLDEPLLEEDFYGQPRLEFDGLRIVLFFVFLSAFLGPLTMLTSTTAASRGDHTKANLYRSGGNSGSAKSLVDAWDSSTGSFVVPEDKDQIRLPEQEEALRAINGLSGSTPPNGNTSASSASCHPSSSTSERLGFVAAFAQCISLIWSLRTNNKSKAPHSPTRRTDTSDGTDKGHYMPSHGSSTSCFGQSSDDIEVVEIGIDYKL